MSSWSAEDIERIAASDDLHIAPFRPDGTTGTPTWIWSVVVNGRLFVRAWNGTRSRWYQAAMTHRGGQITVAGTTYNARFHPADPALAELIDAAYRAKYAASSYLPPMVSPGPQAATVEITPRSTDQD
ncbi:DUF2255 family protein [Sinomonas gamaensis]|uniref:DUF2255 family protein n=1 Tax=Sinomonas gamaensis TaxID=2565624 RepID=UPI001109A7A9|nr:DUF2255 family protein [Sinomonas gamaensis]